MQASQKIRVVLVDDHPLIHIAVESLLDGRGDMEIVGQGYAGADLFPLLDAHQPDILLLDIGMPQHPGQYDPRFDLVAALAQMTARAGRTRVIILSQLVTASLIEGAIDHGVRGYVLKSDNISLELASAVAAVHHGGVYFSRRISDQLFTPTPPPRSPLTSRQVDIILAIARDPDATYAQLAQQLHISESTFKGHLQQAFRALGANNATAAVLRSMQARLIPFSFLEDGRLVFGER